METDVLIIGGGVIGSCIARQLCRYHLDITLVEKQSDVCMGTSKANSSMVHDGYNIDGHKLKGRLCLEANTMYEKMCRELNVDYRPATGSIFAGFTEDHLAIMKQQLENSKTNGLSGLYIANHDQMMALEPNISREVQYGLVNPNTGTINPFDLTMALAENAVMNGVKVFLETEVTNIHTRKGKIESVETNIGRFKPKVIINAAGLYSDQIAGMVEKVDGYIHPRKGSYFLYDKKWGDHVKHCIYSPPTPVSKGMIMVPTTEGNILAGSNAVEVNDREDFATVGAEMDEIYSHTIHRLFPKMPRMGEVITAFAGLRAASNTEDFIIGHAKTVPAMINLIGIQSPGLSSAPAIARMAEELVRETGEDLDFSERPDYNPNRPAPVILRNMDPETRSALIQKNPDYGSIVCRCETISKGEILDAIRRPIPARNLDAIKRRTRAGMGRCQGGFCGPRVVGILEEELGITPLNITKRGGRSNILLDKTKDLSLLEGGANSEKIQL